MDIINTFKNKADWFYYYTLTKELHDMHSVLDIGCGSWSPLARVPKTFSSVGLDIFPQSIQKIKKLHIHDSYIVANVLKVDKQFKQKSFDAVIALDLIEHLKKDEGIELLEKMQRIAKKKVIIMTPNGYYDQEPYENNPYQIHKSGWYVSDFKSRGFKVNGIRGVKFIRGKYATIKYKPWIFWGSISTITEPIFYFLPKYSYQLFAVKNL